MAWNLNNVAAYVVPWLAGIDLILKMLVESHDLIQWLLRGKFYKPPCILALLASLVLSVLFNEYGF
jgi:hypothetical protein